MFQLDEPERLAFITAASACLEHSNDAIAPRKHLVDLLAQLHATYKVLPTLRFQGHLFRVKLDGDRVIGALILREADIVDVE
jgi:hypothetical protein